MNRALVWAALFALVGCGGDEPPVPRFYDPAPEDSGSGFFGDSKTEACDSSPLPADVRSAVGLVSCESVLVIGNDPILFEVRISAEPLGPIGGETAFEVQGQLINPERVAEIVAEQVMAQWLITEASVELDQLNGSDPTTLNVAVPCAIDYADDTDENGRPGPTALTTGIDTTVWTAADDSITVEATDMTFLITTRLGSTPLAFSTKGPEPGCAWIEVPRLTFGSSADF